MRSVPGTALLMGVLVVVVPSAFGYHGDGWDKEHAGAQVWSVQLPSTHKMAVMQHMTKHLDVLHHSDSEALVHVRTQNLETANRLVKTYKLPTKVVVEDLADYLREEHSQEESRALSTRAGRTCTATRCPKPLVTSYMTFQQMEWFLESLAAQYPNNVELSSQGKSTQGRNLWLVKIFQTGATSGTNQKAVFVEGGIHAREWISPATVLNIIASQARLCAAGKVCPATFYFMPMINPDGYVYTWTSDRMWRKNRANPYGTDLNRNFGYFWGRSGASSNTRSEVYKGPSAFSAPESSAERDALKAIKNDPNSELALFISFHSYGQQVLYPWSYSTSPVPASRASDIKAANIYATVAKRVNNVAYSVLQSAGLYPAAGTSDDYAKSQGAKFAYTVELRDTGSNNFILPSNQIKPTFQENWTGFKAMVRYAVK